MIWNIVTLTALLEGLTVILEYLYCYCDVHVLQNDWTLYIDNSHFPCTAKLIYTWEVLLNYNKASLS